jgi:hypothetical protein
MKVCKLCIEFSVPHTFGFSTIQYSYHEAHFNKPSILFLYKYIYRERQYLTKKTTNEKNYMKVPAAWVQLLLMILSIVFPVKEAKITSEKAHPFP